MNLTTLTHRDALCLNARFTSREEAIHALTQRLAALGKISSTEQFLEEVYRRESLGPTGVGHGIALPHARLEEISGIVGVFVRLEKPLDYDSVDRQPVDLIFGLFAPKDSGVEHLKALALVSRTMRDPGICAKLRANIDPAKLHAVLTEGRSSAAA